MTHTDTQLKQALAKMLPEKLQYYVSALTWRCKDLTNNTEHYLPVLDTELLHLCWLVEETTEDLLPEYREILCDICGQYQVIVHATWQQRVVALAKVKGIEIV